MAAWRAYVLTLTIGLPACTAVTGRPPATPSVAVSPRAVCPAAFGPFEGSCAFDLGDLRVAVDGHGNGTVHRDSRFVSSFALPLDKGDLERLYYLDYGGDVVIIFEASDGESDWGGIIRLDPGAASTRWTQHIPAFNVGPGTLERAGLYVTAIGFIARVDMHSGRYAWKHERLYCEANGAFNAFTAPRLTPTDAWFEEATLAARPSLTIRVRKADGHPLSSLTDRCRGPATSAPAR